ncbi:hypothetical protein EPD60_10165 [Flaviaesturariibacter flavus]|uniref:Uncharacterized protein n=1 Tax=Flaviaesturariibacter flavus TaxID=2502780 RepID=A0A4R1BBJ5_9BACT|nr:hypothetical protein [Flaviaesturariibacter flavus]TCJ14353.1 hypothetical protein EPD60_10165 [Flaviaesturariibacter flavus]
MNRILIAGSVLLLMAFRCRQDYPCAEQSYTFGVTGSYTPAPAVVDAGDTVFFESVIARQLYDSLSGRAIDYSNAKGIEGSVSLYRIDTLRHRISTDSVTARFLLLDALPGPVSGTTQHFLFREGPAQYQARVGVIVGARGIYALYATGPVSSGLQGQDCGGAAFHLRVAQSAASAALFQQAMNRLPGPGEDRLYTFRVQ